MEPAPTAVAKRTPFASPCASGTGARVGSICAPLSPMAPAISPRESGDAMSALTAIEPADSPAIVTRPFGREEPPGGDMEHVHARFTQSADHDREVFRRVGDPRGEVDFLPLRKAEGDCEIAPDRLAQIIAARDYGEPLAVQSLWGTPYPYVARPTG